MAENVDGVFHLAIENIFGSWTAFQLAVSHGLGGIHSAEKATWMVGATEQWFGENEGIEPWELVDFLAEILSQEFDTVVDDGSLQQVAEHICGCYRLCASGNLQEVIEKVTQLKKPALDQCVQQQGDSDDEETPPVQPNQIAQTLESMTIDETESRNTEETGENMEDDGWEVVNRKPKKK